jgi:hypothetical protein
MIDRLNFFDLYGYLIPGLVFAYDRVSEDSARRDPRILPGSAARLWTDRDRGAPRALRTQLLHPGTSCPPSQQTRRICRAIRGHVRHGQGNQLGVRFGDNLPARLVDAWHPRRMAGRPAAHGAFWRAQPESKAELVAPLAVGLFACVLIALRSYAAFRHFALLFAKTVYTDFSLMVRDAERSRKAASNRDG